MAYMQTLNLVVDDDATKTMELLAGIEEEYSCSGGICPAQDESNFLPIYVFSNVNNGVPKESCHTHIADVIGGRVNLYFMGFVICLSIDVLIMAVYISVILYRGFKSLRNYC